MGILLIVLFVSAGVGALCIWGAKKGERMGNAAVGATAVNIIGAIILTVVICVSYGSYVDMRTQYDATIRQYRGAVTMYAGHATIDIKKAAFTDLVYQGYQANVADFIKDLRREIIKYNKKLISKRIMNKNFMFGWLVIAPDKDMKVINMLEDLSIRS